MTRASSSFLFWLGMVIMASIMLYHTSDRVNELDAQLRTLNAQIDQEQESLHVLKAEWVYLANPARVEAEATHYLNLQPTAIKRVADLQNIALLLPVHNGTESAPVFAEATPDRPVLPTAAPVKQILAEATRTRHVAYSGSGHINDHMIMQHAAAAASTDKIGALIGTLGLHP